MANEEHILHKADDWHLIGRHMPSGGSPDIEFAWHVFKKADKAISEKGKDFVYGETVTQTQAETIRSVAKQNDIKPVKGGSST